MEAAAPAHLEDVDALTYLPLVGHVVHQLAARYPRSVDRTAMWNAGAAGLLYAAGKAGAPSLLFSQHAIRVIRAAILDTIDVTAPRAVVITDAALAEGFGIAAAQLATLRETQIGTRVAASIAPQEPPRLAPVAAAALAYR